MKRAEAQSATNQSPKRLRELTIELQRLEEKLRLGGGPEKIERQHKQGKLTARERVKLLLDQDSYTQEIGLLGAYDQYRSSGQWAVGSGQETKDQEQETRSGSREAEDVGAAPAAGVVT